MAPPFTLRRSSGIPSLSRQYSTCTAKASLSSHRSMSPTLRPKRLSTLGMAYTGPMPISSGSQPATANPRKRPKGFKPRLLASSSLITTQAPAPSENWLALPAEIKPPGMADLRLANASTVEPSRMPSSLLTVTCLVIRPITLSAIPALTVMAAISASNKPAACAANARCWLRAPYSSMASRPMLYFLATCSAVCSMFQYISGFFFCNAKSTNMC